MKRILVINDTQVILEMFQAILEEEGYEVILSSYPLQRVEEITYIHPDLIILDLIFGGEVAGWQMLQLIKMQRATANIPIIVCTAAVQAVKEIEAYLMAKGVHIVFKPFDINDLLDAIQKTLHEFPQSASYVAKKEQAADDDRQT